MKPHFTEAPERWAVVKISSIDGSGVIYKLFGTWGGSYLYGQSWKINSGITGVTKEGKFFYFKGASGSVYRCHENAYGFFSYGASVLSNLQEVWKKEVTIEVMPEDTDWLTFTFKTDTP